MEEGACPPADLEKGRARVLLAKGELQKIGGEEGFGSNREKQQREGKERYIIRPKKKRRPYKEQLGGEPKQTTSLP